RVNAVAPGVVWTPRVSAFLGDEGLRRNVDNAPLGRVAQPADIAAAILFLACDLSAYVTGQTLVVDGGVGAKFPYPRPPSEDCQDGCVSSGPAVERTTGLEPATLTLAR